MSITMQCPSKNTDKNWKILSNLVGEKEAYRAYILNNYNSPTIERVIDLGLVDPNKIFNDADNIDILNEGSVLNYLTKKRVITKIKNLNYLVGTVGENKYENLGLIKLFNYKFGNIINYRGSINKYDHVIISYNNKDVTFNQLSDDDVSYYVNQLDNYKEKTGKEAPKEMREVVEKLISSQSKILFDGTQYVNTVTGQIYKRVSDLLNEINNGYFAYDGIEEDYDDNKEYGNQLDNILQSVLLGRTLEQSINELKKNIVERKKDLLISEEILENVYDIFNNFKSKYPDHLILTQMVFANDKTGIAGTADIVLVNPKGEIAIIDLKSSVKSTQVWENYEKRYGAKKSSKSERHAAQLSSYKGLAMGEGFIFQSENELQILPLYLKNTDDRVVTEIEEEPIIQHDAVTPIVNTVFEEAYSKISPEEEGDYNKLINKIKTALEERLILISKSSTNKKKTKYEENEIEKLKNKLNSIEKAKALSNFIDELYNTFIEKEVKGNKYSGLIGEFQSFIKKVNNNSISDSSEIVNNMMYYKNSADVYNEIIKDLKEFYTTNVESSFNKNINSDSPLGKIKTIIDSFDYIYTTVNKSLIPVLSKELSKYASTKGNQAYLLELKGQTDKLEQAKKEKNEKKIKYYTKQIERLKDKYGEKGVDTDYIQNILEFGANEDIPLIDMLVSPAISSSNAVIGTFAVKLKAAFENARLKSIDFQREAISAFNKYKQTNSVRNNVAKFNEGLYEKVSVWDFREGKIVEKMSFVQDYDVTAFEKSKKQMYEKMEELTESKDKKALFRKWELENTEKLDDADWIINGVVIRKGIDTLIKEKQEDVNSKLITQKEFDFWLNSNREVIDGKYYYRNEFTKPSTKKFPNAKYNSLSGAKLEYYNFLISNYFKAQEKVSYGYRKGFILPSIVKNDNDRLRENGIINYLKYEKEDALRLTEKDVETLGEPTKGTFKVVPMLYSNYMPAEDVSLDLISSIMLYSAAADKYEASVDLSNFAQATLDTVSANQPLARTAMSEKIINLAAKKAGVEGYDKYLKKHSGNNIAALLEAFIDMQIYGKTKEAEQGTLLGVPVDYGKITDTLMSFASKTQIGGNVMGSVANSLQANAALQLEAIAEEFIGKKEIAEAKLEYYKNINNFIKDFTDPVNKSLIGQLIDLYDPLQGEFRDKYGRKISQSVAKKLWSTDTWFFLQHQGEHAIQIQTMIALMKRQKVTQNGKEISLYNAYELDSNGKIKLKEGVQLNGLVSNNGLMSLSTQNTLHAMSKRMHGVYNSLDQATLQRYSYGRLILMFRKFVVPGFKKRYKSFSIDQELGGTTEGFHLTFFKLLFKDTKQLMRELSPLHKSNLTPMEKNNVKRSATELAYIGATALLVMIIHSLMENAGDEDKKKLRYPLYWALRLNSELSAFLDPRDTYRSFRYPTAAYGTIDRFLKLAGDVFSPTEKYERDTGMWEKGDLKILADLFKLMGITGGTANPDELVKVLESQTK